jgi:prepilin-type N-terminal cleavage/methylation domain-containing protein
VKRSEAGFTLIEMLVAIVIMGVVSIPLGNAMISYLRNTATTGARIGESHDAQISSAYWAQDIASIGVRDGYDSIAKTFPLQQSVNTSYPCVLPTGSSTLVVLAWDQTDAAGAVSPVRVAYVTRAGGTELYRQQCTGSTPDAGAVLAHELDPATPPVLVCDGSGGSTCTGSDGAVPARISLTLRIKDPSGKGQPYSVVLSGQRRQS